MKRGTVVVAVSIGGPQMSFAELDRMAVNEHLTGENINDPAVYLAKLEERARKEKLDDDIPGIKSECPILHLVEKSLIAASKNKESPVKEIKNSHRARILHQRDKILSVAKGVGHAVTKRFAAFSVPVQAMRPPRGKKPSSRSKQKVLLKTSLVAL